MRKETPLRKFRRARTMTQADLARLARVNQATIAKLEAGKTASPDLRAILSAILGVSESDLFETVETVESV